MSKSVIKATKEGKLYIETKDFFQQPEIIKQIQKLKESKIVKYIDSKNKKK